MNQKELKSVIDYNPETGVFTWIKSRGFIRKGTVCKGDTQVHYKGKHYLKKRLAWLYMTGNYTEQPLMYVDGDMTNNKFINIVLKSSKTINKNHVDIGVTVSDDSYHIFVIKEGKTVDLGIHDKLANVTGVLGKYLCSL